MKRLVSTRVENNKGEQIDRINHVLTINRTWCTHTNGIRPETKGHRIRRIGLNASVQRIVYPIVKDGLIFNQPDGQPLRTDYLYQKLLPKVCKKAGVKFIGCHGLRHTFASNYMMNKGNVYDLQKILGHESVKTTGRYAHLSREHMQQAARVIEFSGDSNVIAVNFGR